MRSLYRAVRRNGVFSWSLRTRRALLRRTAQFLTLLATGGMLLSNTPSAWAISATWVGTTDALWATDTNWSAAPAPGVGDTATFNAAAGTGGTTITTGTISLGTLAFDLSAAAAYTIGGATAGTGQITFADGTTNIITRSATVTANELVNANIILGTAATGNSTISNASTTGTLTIAGNITGGTGGTAGNKTLTLAGAGNIALTGVVSKGGASNLILQDNSTGTTTLSNAGNGVFQQVFFNGGGTSTVLDLGATGVLKANNAGGTTIQTQNTTSATITGGQIALQAADGDWGAANGTTLTLNSQITGAFRYENFVANNGTGVTVLGNANNSFTGGLLISSSIVSVANVGRTGFNSNTGTGSTITIGSAANNTTALATLRYTGAGEVTDKIISLGATTGGAAIDASGTGAVYFNSAAAIATGAGIKTFTLTGSGAGRLDSIIADNTATNKTSLSKTGAGTWILGGVETFTGTVSVTGGNLVYLKSQTVPGAVTVNNAGLNYFATSDAALTLASTIAITGGANAAIGGTIGATTTSSQITVTGQATGTAAALKVNVYGLSGVTPATGTYTLLAGGAGSTLNNLIPTLGLVYNNSNFTVGAPTTAAAAITVPITSATALPAAFWNGGLTGATNVWAASNGTTASNWVTAAGGGATGLVPGGTTAVTIAATTPTVVPTSTVLGANMAIGSLTIANTGGLGIGVDGYALTVNSGITMNSGVAASTIASGLVTGGAQSWTNNSTSMLTLSGPIGGTGLVTKAGTGPLTISGLGNTYSGGLTLSTASTLNLNSATALGTGTFTIGAAGTIDNTFGSAITMSTNNVLALNSNFTFTGTSDLNMGTGAATINGARTITVNAGTLTLGGTFGMGAFALTKNGNGVLRLNGVISGTTADGSTSLTINAGEVIIGGTTNTFQGNFLVTGSTAVLTMANGGTSTGFTTSSPFGATSGGANKAVTLQNGATLRLLSGTYNDNGSTSTNKAAGQNYTIGTGGATFDVASGATLIIDDGGQLIGSTTLTKTGLGIYQMDDATSFTGAIDVQAGSLYAASAANTFGSNTTNGITIRSGAALNVNNQALTQAKPITINGTGLAASPAGAITNNGATAGQWAGPVTLGSASTIGSTAAGGLTLTSTATINTAGNALTFAISGAGRIFTDGVISGSGAVVVNGSSTGDYVPRTQHTYTGGTTLNAGSFTAVDAISAGPAGNPTSGPFGAGPTPLILNGGQMRSGTGGDRTVGNTVTLAADTTFYSVGSEKSLIFTGPVTMTGGTRTLNSAVGNNIYGAQVFFNGNIGDGGLGYGLIKTGTGNLTLGGTNSYSGGTTVNAGVLTLTGSLANSTALTVNAGGSFSLWSGAANPLSSISALSLGAGTGVAQLGFDLGTTSDSLTSANAATTANTIMLNLAGITGFGAGSYNLITAASGLDTANYIVGAAPIGYTYTVNKTAGQVSVNVANVVPTLTNMYWRGAVSGSWAGLNAGNSNFTTDAGGTTNSGTLPGYNSTVNFSASNATTGAISTTLDTNITVNNLNFTSSPALVTGVTIGGGATGNVLMIRPQSASDGIAIAQGAGAISIPAPINLGSSQTWSVDSSTPGTGTASSLNVSGQISGAAGASLTVTSTAGTAPIILSGAANVYSGNTTISANTILQGGIANAFSPNSALVVNGTFNTGAFATQAVGSLIGGSGTVQNGSATASTLTIGSDNLASATFGGVIQDGSTAALGITKAGTGTQTITGTSNTYTGATTVSAGTLKLGATNALSTASALTLSGATLDLNGFSQTFNGAITSSVATATVTNSSTSTSASTTSLLGTPTGTGIYVDALTTQATGNIAALITDGPTRKTQVVLTNGNSAPNFTNGSNSFSGGLILLNSASGTRLNPNAVIAGTPYGTGPIVIGQAPTDKAGIVFNTAANQTLTNPIIFNTALGTDRVGIRSDVAGITLSGVITANLAPATFTSNTAVATFALTNQVTGSNGLVLDIVSLSAAATAFKVTLNNATVNANNYQGDTVVNYAATTGKSATLALGTNNQIPNGPGTGTVILNSNGTGIGLLDLAGFSDTINGLSGNGTVDGTTGSPILTLGDNNATATFSGIIQNTAGTLSIVKIGSGTQTLTGASTFTGSVAVNGGLLAFSNSPVTGGALGNSTAITLNGGGISYTGNNTSNALNRTVTIGAGDGTINVADSLGNLTLPGASLTSTGGNLIKTGPGTATITGSVSLNGGLAGVTVNGGKLVAGFGTNGVSSINVGASGNLSLVNGAIEALTLGNTAGALTLNGGARLGFELSGATNDSIAVGATGTAVTGGTITLDFAGTVAAGTYNLLSSTLGGLNAATFVLGSAPNGFNYTINKTDNLVSLTTTAYQPIYWRGGQDSSWNTLGAATANWTTDLAGTVDALAKPGAADTVIFSATGAPTVTNTITTTLDGAFTVDSVQFSNVPTGVTAVTINAGTGGSLTLTPVSTSGGIKVLAGGGNATIAAPLTVGAAQTWDVDPTGSLTISGNTTFNANVSKTGAGMLTLSGNNSGTGNITLNAGTLNINSNTALGGGTLTINPGTTIDSTVAGISISSSNPQNWNGSFAFTGTNSLNMGNGTVNVSNNPTVTVGANTLTVGGVVSGASGLTKAGAGTLVLSANNTYTGTTNVNAGSLTLAGDNSATTGQTVLGGGTLNLNHAKALSLGTLVINSGGLGNTSAGPIVNAGSQAITVNGDFAFSGPNDLNLGSSPATLSVTPTITTSAGTLTMGNIASTPLGLNKAGAGTLTLVGANQYAGNTTITGGGTFNLNGSLTGNGTTTMTGGTYNLSGSRTGTGNTTINGGTYNLTGSLIGNNTSTAFAYGNTAGNTVVNMSGTLNAFVTTGANIAGSVTVFNQTAGSVTIVPTTSADVQWVAKTGFGALNITGGTFNTGRFDVNATGGTNPVGVAYIGGSGTLNQNQGDWLIIAYNGIGQMTVAPGGTVTRAAVVNNPFAITMNGTNSNGTLNVVGGAVDTGTRALQFGFSSPGAGNQGFVNLASGTFALGASTTLAGTTGSTSEFFNFLGGTLKSNAAITSVPASATGHTVVATVFGPVSNNSLLGNNTQDFNGGAIIDTNGFATTIAAPLTAATGFGVTQANISPQIPAAGTGGNSGYITAPAVTFNTPAAAGGVPASGYALVSNGSVTGIVITNPGTYAASDSVTMTLTGGGGTISPLVLGTLSTANVSGGLTKIGANTLTLSGANTYTGATTITNGTLQLGAAGATGSLSPSSAISIGTGATFAVNRTDTVTQGTTFAGNLTGLGSFAQNGTGTTILSTANTYGATTIGAGVLQVGNGATDTVSTLGTGAVTMTGGTIAFNRSDNYTLPVANTISGAGAVQLNMASTLATAADNQINVTGNLVMGASAGSTVANSLNLTNGSATFGGLLVQNSTATPNIITVGAGKTLTINGNVQIGQVGVPTVASTPALTVNGGGSMVVTTAAGGLIQIGGSNGGTTGNLGENATLDLTGLSSAVLNTSATGTIRVNNPQAGNTTGVQAALFLPTPTTGILPTTPVTTITANNLNVGDAASFNSISTQINQIVLGTGLTTLNVNTINIGTGSRDIGTMTVATGNGTIKIRGTDGISRNTALNVGTGGATTGTTNAATNDLVDFTGHSADLLLGTLNVGNQARVGNLNSDFKFDTGTLDVTGVTVGFRTGTATTTATLTDTITLGGGTVTIGSGGLEIGNSSYNQTGITALNGTVNISGGSVTIANSATLGAAVRMSTNSGGATNAANVTSLLNIAGGTVTVSGDIIRGSVTGTQANTATVTLNGGTLDMGGKNIGSSASTVVLNAQTGTLKNLAELNGGGALAKSTPGTMVLTGNLAYTGATNVTDGTLTYDAASIFNPAVANGMLTVNGATAVANIAGTYNSPNGNGNAYVTVQGGGVLNFSGTSALTNAAGNGGFRIGEGSAGTMNMTAGTMTLTLNSGSNLVVGRSASGNGLLNISGGTLTVANAGGLQIGNTAGNSGTITIGGTGQLVMNSTGSLVMGPGTSTINLNTGGTFTLASAATASGTSTINFNGGTLKAGLNTASFLPTALTAANVLAGGAILDTNGFNVTIGNNLQSGVAGDGGLTKNGAGTLALDVTQGYLGATTVNTGTLQLKGGTSLATSGLTLSTGTTLAVSNAASGVTVSGATGLSLPTGATTLSLVSSTPFSTTTPVINLTNAAATLATTAGGTTTLGLPDVAYAVGSYPIIRNLNAITLAGGFATGTLPSRIAAATVGLDGTGKVVQLNVTAINSLVWDGSVVGGAWDINTTQNWKLAGNPAKYIEGDSVVFDDTLGVGNTTNVSLNGTVNPGSVLFNNSTANTYTLSGTGKISGSTGLTVNGTGTVHLHVLADYTGQTTVNNGMLHLDAPGTLGASTAPLQVTGGILDLGTTTQTVGTTAISGGVIQGGVGNSLTASSITATPTTSATISANLAGASTPLTVNGAGTLILSGTNTYGGTTTITAGTLQIGNAGTTGTLGSGTVTNNGALTFNRTDSLTVANAISGTGSLTQAGTGTTILTGANSYGATTISAGTLQIGNAGTTGSLGSGAVTNNASLVFNRTDSVTVANAISGTGNLTQAGTGTTILTGANSYGTTTISGGTLQIGNAGTTGSLGSGAVTNNAALAFNRTDSLTVANAISGTGSLTQAGTGTLSLTALNTYTGVTNLNAGIVNVGSVETPGTSGPLGNQLANAAGTILFGGGTLQYSAANQADYSGRFSTAAGQAIKVDTNGQSVTFATALTSTGGTLAKSGTGSLTLSAANTYSGSTTVSAGTLVAANSTGSALGTGDLTLNGGTFASAVTGGSITGTVIAGSGAHTIAPGGIGSIGALTVGGLTLSANSTLNFDITTNTTLDALTTGALAAGGLVNIQVPTGLAVNTYKLVGYGSTALTDATSFQINGGNIPAGYSLNLDTTNKELDLIVASVGPINLTWGGGTGGWSSGGAGWLNAGNPANWSDGNNAIIGAGTDTAGTITVTGTVKPTTMTFNAASTGNYTVTGGTIDMNGTTMTITANTAATINSTIANGSLTKAGTSTLTLTGTHTYTGPTNVSAGTLQVGTPTTAGSIAASSGVTVASSASFVAGSNTTVKSLNLSANGANASILAGALRILTVGDGTSDTGLLDLSGTNSKLDLNSGAIVLNFNSAGVGTSLRDTIKNLIGTGKIMSSRAVAANLADPNTPVGIGYALGDYTSVGLPSDATSIVARYTLVGDANLDGVVDVGDLGTALAPNYGSPSGNYWQSGDFNGDGAVDTSDLALLAANYGKTLTLPGDAIGNLNLNFEQDLAQAFASVPEPGTLSLVGLAALALLKRRNRSSRKAA